MNEMQRKILFRRDGAMDRASRGGNRSSGGMRSGNRGGNRGGGRSDGHYPYMPFNPMGRGGYHDYEMGDGRRGVKGSGRSKMRDRGEMPYDREMDYERDDYEMGDYGYEDDEDYGYNDYEMGEMEEMRLSKHDMRKWKEKMINADGTKGEHFTMEKLEPMAQKAGIRFKEYSEKEFCLVANMLYSDYCEVTRSYVSPEHETMFYVKLAKAWLEDEDAPEGSEKLALYYHCVVNAQD